MTNFNVGDVCIILSDPAIVRRELIGTDCTIVGWIQDDKHDCVIHVCTGETIRGATRVLRKKPPPREQLGSWAKLRDIWRPKELRSQSVAVRSPSGDRRPLDT